MGESLGVWYRGSYVGEFSRQGSATSLSYDANYSGPPVSLSLPVGERHARRAAEHYLENLLPDNPRVRRRWSAHLGVSNTAFDVLAFMGEDLAGAFSLMPEGTSPRSRDEPLVLAAEDDIHYRSGSIQNDEDLWVSVDQIGKVRMSLAGAQGKFSLVSADGVWFWPSVNAPSTHIFKPESKRLPGLAILEAGSLALARDVGVSAPQAYASDFGSTKGTYVVERFDRETLPGSAQVVRTHAEDFAQAYGRKPGDKYSIPARDVVAMLAENAADKDEPYRFVEQLAFNVAVGNADAHGKNYSVLLRERGDVVLAPLYDAVPTAFYPKVNSSLGMKVGRARNAKNVQVGDWLKFAKESSLDPERVVAVAARVHAEAAGRVRDAFINAGAGTRMADRVDEIVRVRTAKLREVSSGGSTPVATDLGLSRVRGTAKPLATSTTRCNAMTREGDRCKNIKRSCPHHP